MVVLKFVHKFLTSLPLKGGPLCPWVRSRCSSLLLTWQKWPSINSRWGGSRIHHPRMCTLACRLVWAEDSWCPADSERASYLPLHCWKGFREGACTRKREAVRESFLHQTYLHGRQTFVYQTLAVLFLWIVFIYLKPQTFTLGSGWHIILSYLTEGECPIFMGLPYV